ncbi:MAG: hypothetical protein NC483_07035 [Ruminococcus sp.]|nr:hypothetical protein [Ruminococcus sp.]
MKIHNDEKLIMIAIAICVLASLFGFSFAYYTIVAPTASGKGGEVKANTSSLGAISYDAGTEKISMNNAMPGTKESKNFTVEVKAGDKAEAVSYSIKLKIDSNSFVKCTAANQGTTINGTVNDCELNAQELIYTLKSGSTVLKTGDLAGFTGSEIELVRETKSPTSDTVYNYTLEVEYKDTGKDQNHNMNKAFSGKIEVVG